MQPATIPVVLLVVAYLLYALAMIVFCFFYTLFGAVLYVVGPLVLALILISEVGQLGKSFARQCDDLERMGHSLRRFRRAHHCHSGQPSQQHPRQWVPRLSERPGGFQSS